MIKLLNLLTESATGVLYHFTNTNRLQNILISNAFQLTSTIGTPSDNLHNQLYYMSFSTTKSTKHGYGTKFTFNDSVRLKCNGIRLNNNYKVVSVDYWQYPRTKDITQNSRSYDEMEERLISDSNEVPNANKYTISIDILNTLGEIDKSIYDNAKKQQIPLYVYINEKDFNTGLPQRAIPESNLKFTDSKTDTYTDNRWIPINILGLLTYKDAQLYNYYVDKFPDYQESIDKEHDKLKHKLHDDDYYLTDLKNTYSSEIHNNKSSPNAITREIIMALGKDFRKNNISHVKDYLIYKYYIGRKSPLDLKIEVKESIKKFFNEYYNTILNSGWSGSDRDGNYYENVYDHPYIKGGIKTYIKNLNNYVNSQIDLHNIFNKSGIYGANLYRELFNTAEPIPTFDKLNDYFENSQIEPQDITGGSLGRLPMSLEDKLYQVVYTKKQELYK